MSNLSNIKIHRKNENIYISDSILNMSLIIINIEKIKVLDKNLKMKS